jgi:hypothetical protein
MEIKLHHFSFPSSSSLSDALNKLDKSYKYLTYSASKPDKEIAFSDSNSLTLNEKVATLLKSCGGKQID